MPTIKLDGLALLTPAQLRAEVRRLAADNARLVASIEPLRADRNALREKIADLAAAIDSWKETFELVDRLKDALVSFERPPPGYGLAQAIFAQENEEDD
jgi:hypothetical protein